MINYKRLISASILLTVTGLAVAQTSTNSPYTRYGFGQLADQNFGNSKAMGGIAYGLRNGYQINASNPASYTAIDSLTFLFDAGMTLQNANFKDGKDVYKRQGCYDPFQNVIYWMKQRLFPCRRKKRKKPL